MWVVVEDFVVNSNNPSKSINCLTDSKRKLVQNVIDAFDLCNKLPSDTMLDLLYQVSDFG